MALLKKRTIFHVEESFPDPEEIKLRFRRRVLGFSFFLFLIVLGLPVARDLRSLLHARAEARRFTERMTEARTLAALMRSPVALELNEGDRGWTRVLYAPGDDCGTESAGPVISYPSERVVWHAQAQRQEEDASLSGRKLCWHPTRGLLLDSIPVDQGQLLISLAPVVLEDGSAPKELAYVLITQGGAEMSPVSY